MFFLPRENLDTGKHFFLGDGFSMVTLWVTLHMLKQPKTQPCENISHK